MYQDFKNEWTRPGHNRVDFDHVFGYQCVDLIQQFFYEVAGVTGLYGNAIDYATKPTASFVNATVRVTDGSKQPGDILVLRGITDPEGHIALRDTNVDQMLEQNAADGNGSGLGRDAIGVYRNIPYDRVVAVYRLKVLINAPAATPAAPSAPPATANIGGKKLFLPTAGGYWRVYPVGGPYTPGHEVGRLWPGNPQWAPGLTYDVLGVLATNIIKIHTDSFGDVAIYVGGDTPAQFVDAAPAPPPPAPAPPAPAPPAPVLAPPAPAPPSNITYSKLEAPLDLVTNKQPTNWWKLDFKDDAHATAAAQLAVDTPFHAYGKAQRTDGDKPCYYMTAEDFGQADTTGTPNNNNGVNTVDLTLPAPPPAPGLKITDNSGSTTPPAAPADDNHVPVNVVPTAPDAWKTSFKVNSAGDYTANADVVIHDLDGDGPDEQLIRGQTVHVGGEFTKAGIEYYRTKKKVADNKWYGIPKLSLTEESLDADEDLFNLDIAAELKHELTPVGLREKAIRQAAIADVKKLHFSNPFKHKK